MPDFLDAADGPKRWAPLLLGVGCVGLWLVGWQQSLITIESWERDYGHGSVATGYWVTGIGAAILAVTGTYATLRYHEGQTGDPTSLIRRPRRSDAGPILTWVAGIGGLISVRRAGARDLPAGLGRRADGVHGRSGHDLGAYGAGDGGRRKRSAQRPRRASRLGLPRSASVAASGRPA